MNLSRFSMAHQWRSGFCATVVGALRKNQWRIGCSIGFFPLARQWRNGALPAENPIRLSVGERAGVADAKHCLCAWRKGGSLKARQGNAQGLYGVHVPQLKGKGVPRDVAEAVKWLRLAVGNPSGPGGRCHDTAGETKMSMTGDRVCILICERAGT
jgi:hypothetical protein